MCVSKEAHTHAHTQEKLKYIGNVADFHAALLAPMEHTHEYKHCVIEWNLKMLVDCELQIEVPWICCFKENHTVKYFSGKANLNV